MANGKSKSDQLTRIAATLAGVTSTLRLVADNGASEAATDSLHLLADVTERLNSEISEMAAREVQHEPDGGENREPYPEGTASI